MFRNIALLTHFLRQRFFPIIDWLYYCPWLFSTFNGGRERLRTFRYSDPDEMSDSGAGRIRTWLRRKPFEWWRWRATDGGDGRETFYEKELGNAGVWVGKPGGTEAYGAFSFDILNVERTLHDTIRYNAGAQAQAQVSSLARLKSDQTRPDAEFRVVSGCVTCAWNVFRRYSASLSIRCHPAALTMSVKIK